jgi:hypothetical protein
MTTLGTQLDKIRSDAAECMLLSKLVPDGKGQVFVRTAEHLNELALELEKSVAINRADAGTDRGSLSAPQSRDHEDAASSNTAGQPPARRRRMLAWMLLAVIILSGVLGASSRQAREYWSPYVSHYVSHSKNDTPPSTQDQTLKAMTALLSGEQAEREKVMGRLNELNARMDVLVSSLNNLNAARDEAAAKPNRASEEEPRSSASQAPAPSVKLTRENATPAPEGSSATRQADSLAPETADQVGSIQAGQRRAEPSPRKPAAGPAGCTQFRSFDPASETYTTLDGRRRECRP